MAAETANGTRPSGTSSVLFGAAQPDDSAAIAGLHNVIAERLTSAFGRGHWSYRHTEQGVRSSMKRAQVFVARRGSDIAATFTVATKKPWAIDRNCFSQVKRPLYLLSMAVAPELQGQGLGRRCLAAGDCEGVAGGRHLPRRVRHSGGCRRVLWQMRVSRGRPRHLQGHAVDLLRVARRAALKGCPRQ